MRFQYLEAPDHGHRPGLLRFISLVTMSRDLNRLLFTYQTVEDVGKDRLYHEYMEKFRP